MAGALTHFAGETKCYKKLHFSLKLRVAIIGRGYWYFDSFSLTHLFRLTVHSNKSDLLDTIMTCCFNKNKPGKPGNKVIITLP